MENANFQVDFILNLVFLLILQMFRQRVETFDAENRPVRGERQEISLNINSNALLEGLAAAVGAAGALFYVLK